MRYPRSMVRYSTLGPVQYPRPSTLGPVHQSMRPVHQSMRPVHQSMRPDYPQIHPPPPYQSWSLLPVQALYYQSMQVNRGRLAVMALWLLGIVIV